MDDSAVIGPDGNKTAYWSESYRKVKNLYQDTTGKKVTTTKLWNDYSKLRGKLKKQNASLGLKASASVAGYLEFSCGSGKPVFSKGGIVTEMKTGADYTFHWNPPFSAVYTRIGVGIAVTMTNTGYEAITGSSIAFYLNSEEDTPIYSGEGSTLAIGETVTKTYTIPENVLEGEEGTASLICVVTPKEEEQETADNTGYLEFSWNKTNPVDPDKPKPDDSKKDENTNKPNDISNRQIKVSSIQIAGISKQIAQGKKVTSMKGIVKKVKITGTKTVKAGKNLKLKANVTATKKANKKLQWTSSNTKYATVNAKGVVKTKKTAKRKTIKITAMATDGSSKKATFKIKVK